MKKLGLPIVIEFGNNNKVTECNHELVNNSLEYEVNTQISPSFWLSILSNHQLDTGRYTSVFGRGKGAIPSPSITVTGNRVNDLYIISPATVLSSTGTPTTSRRSKMIRQRASTITHSTEPITSPLQTTSSSSASTAPHSSPTAESPMPLAISESGQWHCGLTLIHPTALRSLNDAYTNDRSMRTARSLANHKQIISKAKTKCTTKSIELMDNSPRPPPLAIVTITYSSMTTHDPPPFGSFHLRCQWHAPQPSKDSRPELSRWDTK